MGNMRLKATAAFHHGNEMRYINDGRRVPFSNIHDFAVQPNVYFDEVCMLYSTIRSYRFTVTMFPFPYKIGPKYRTRKKWEAFSSWFSITQRHQL
jgi:hypothetical protein